MIKCILADVKANQHTYKRNIFSRNGCATEFIVNTSKFHKTAKRMGNVSYVNKKWRSPVVEIKVYKKNIFKK